MSFRLHASNFEGAPHGSQQSCVRGHLPHCTGALVVGGVEVHVLYLCVFARLVWCVLDILPNAPSHFPCCVHASLVVILTSAHAWLRYNCPHANRTPLSSSDSVKKCSGFALFICTSCFVLNVPLRVTLIRRSSQEPLHPCVDQLEFYLGLTDLTDGVCVCVCVCVCACMCVCGCV